MTKFYLILQKSGASPVNMQWTKYHLNEKLLNDISER